jgi:hypothetical protein
MLTERITSSFYLMKHHQSTYMSQMTRTTTVVEHRDETAKFVPASNIANLVPRGNYERRVPRTLDKESWLWNT